ncbi:hypothetical protein TRVL_06902 [Trypanosoma vivax]|nr:hypothetical protein TRVL_06902 [Trypanosoma vivax]
MLCSHVVPAHVPFATRLASKANRRGSRHVAFIMTASFAYVFSGPSADGALPIASTRWSKLRAPSSAVADLLSPGLGPRSATCLLTAPSAFFGGGIQHSSGRGVHCFRGCCAFLGFQ